MALFAVQFSKNFQESMPPDPLKEAPTFGGRHFRTEKILHFLRIPLKVLKNEAKILSVIWP